MPSLIRSSAKPCALPATRLTYCCRNATARLLRPVWTKLPWPVKNFPPIHPTLNAVAGGPISIAQPVKWCAATAPSARSTRQSCLAGTGPNGRMTTRHSRHLHPSTCKKASLCWTRAPSEHGRLQTQPACRKRVHCGLASTKTQATSTNGSVSAGMPKGSNAAATAAYTTAVARAASSA